MKYISVTEVDAGTKIPCTVEPQRTGPSFPMIKGLQILWCNQSIWPVKIVNGVYETAPLYYGTCDEDADLSLAGFIAEHTENEYRSLKNNEHQARKPFPSWIGNEETMTWEAPVSRPSDSTGNGGNIRYQWDEETLEWVSAA